MDREETQRQRDIARGEIPRDREAWQRFLGAERKEVELRKTGHLARAIGKPLQGESAADLERIAQEDQRKAEEGLVELRSGDRVWHKHVDELLPKDRIYRAEAEGARIQWLRARLEQRP
jgi:hypothetical protein